MPADLSPDNQHFIEHVVATGQYGSRDEVVDAAVSRLRAYHEFRQAINVRVEAMENGERIELESDEQLREFFDQIKRDGRRRLAEAAGNDLS